MVTETKPAELDTDQMMAFTFKMVGDLAAAINGGLIYAGDRLGLFKLLAAEGPLTTDQLAAKTGFQERYLREWASALTAGEILDYDPQAKTFAISAEKAMVLANEDSPVFVMGGFQMVPDHYDKVPQFMKAMQEGGGIPYSEYSDDTFEGTERFFKPGYVNSLVDQWLPATGLKERLEQGGKVADVGCGRGWAIITMARAFPKSTFYGFDNHAPGIEAATANARKEGAAANATFEERGGNELPQTGDFDLISNLDSLHDMVDPEGCARSVRGALKPDGGWFVVEPNVSDKLEENIGPVGRAFYSFSSLQCMPASLSQGGKGYGACMGPGRLNQIAREAGFTRAERLPIDNPFNALWLFRP
ncbi:MAG: class I SAM-dependent methyltransferase [Dehalococcoidia bacterium]